MPEPHPELLRSPDELRQRCQAWRSEGDGVGLVPTMGALHRGHLELIRAALRDCSRVVVSIFVNPLQFGKAEDLASYPRDVDADLRLLRREGVDACYFPDAETVYPAGFATRVEVEMGPDLWEARSRPGHFRGVATIVTKLLAASGPCRAYFGEKDAQQVAVVSRLARDLDLGVEIVVRPVVREEDGLAMSSRNRLLSPRGRVAAGCLFRALTAARSDFARGNRSGEDLARLAAAAVKAEPLAQLDYAGVVNPGDFSPVASAESDSRVLLAAQVDSVRLIDTGLLGIASDRLG